MITCPVCNLIIETDDEALTHLMTQHELFIITYLSMFSDETEIEEENYENLSRLCDEMGNHYIGLTNEQIENVAPIKDLEESDYKECCPICLDDFISSTYLRKINKCNHIYCGQCIEKWLEKNHNCPVCKDELKIINVNDID